MGPWIHKKNEFLAGSDTQKRRPELSSPCFISQSIHSACYPYNIPLYRKIPVYPTNPTMYSSHVRASRSQFKAKLRSLSFKLLSCKFSHCGDGTSRALMDSEIGHAWCYIIGVETPNFSNFSSKTNEEPHQWQSGAALVLSAIYDSLLGPLQTRLMLWR